ncbi:hypothetical protein O6H91_17G087300 [Diphasiastrum complanatum]|uniref:Uncharacterized protein n=1 Tax=Diphasiastrum complanatum TaxID=34168 RepID=A0ACC2B8X6_DIPCM|nr:hypothetical protein O6H91_17G087300 [Diphasiastrum complanatum]
MANCSEPIGRPSWADLPLRWSDRTVGVPYFSFCDLFRRLPCLMLSSGAAMRRTTCQTFPGPPSDPGISAGFCVCFFPERRRPCLLSQWLERNKLPSQGISNVVISSISPMEWNVTSLSKAG